MRTCEKCTSADLVTVQLAINGEPVTFDHCRRCEHRTWSANGDKVGLSDVLDRVSP
jgi:hypothetical protein